MCVAHMPPGVWPDRGQNAVSIAYGQTVGGSPPTVCGQAVAGMPPGVTSMWPVGHHEFVSGQYATKCVAHMPPAECVTGMPPAVCGQTVVGIPMPLVVAGLPRAVCGQNVAGRPPCV